MSLIYCQAVGVIPGALNRESQDLSQKIMSLLHVRQDRKGGEPLWLSAPALGSNPVTHCVTWASCSVLWANPGTCTAPALLSFRCLLCKALP